MARKLTKDKSLYTIKKIHTKTSNGCSIYETDYVTTPQGDDGSYGGIQLYSNSNMKFIVDDSNNSKKRHIKNGWVLNESGSTKWTMQNIDINAVSNESNIVLKPEYKSLSDFAYYGSATALIEYAIKNIIKNFPAGLYFYTYSQEAFRDGDIIYYFVSNECEIDCWTDNVMAVEKGTNPLRYLSYSYNKYVDSNGNVCEKPILSGITGTCCNSIIGSVVIGGHTLYVYKDKSDLNHLVTTVSSSTNNIIIEPNINEKKSFWNTLNSFERVLLNKDSRPIYKATFDTIYETEDGYFYTPVNYILPTVDGTDTPYLTSTYFKYYLENLMSLADFHDNYNSNNIWRMMVHDSIKNMGERYAEEDNVDFSRMKALLQIQAIQFDELKMYIDGIKKSNSISYDGNGNTPDYVLTDIVDNYGWDTRIICSNKETLEEDIKYIGNENEEVVLEAKGKTSDYINSVFFRYLALSSSYIQSKKGTKNSIETVLGLFGFDIYGDDPDVEIIEYYAKHRGDFLKLDDATCLGNAFIDFNEFMETALEGYPVKEIITEVDGEKEEILLVPWFDGSNYRNEDNFYYQCKGGWGRTNLKYINNNLAIETNVTHISGDTLYKETLPYILCVPNVNRMLRLLDSEIKTNMICYVEDISGIKDFIPTNEEQGDYIDCPTSVEACSHYFVLHDTCYSGIIGNSHYDVTKVGWRNVSLEELRSANSEDAIRVLNVESIFTNYKGNNPHTGYDDYDFGYDYLDKYNHIFRGDIKEGLCDNLDEETYNEIANYGFNLQISGTTEGKTFEYVTGNIDELDSYRIVNTKNLTIRFKSDNEEMRKYIINIVIPYIENVIPSTMIVEYLFGDEESYINTMQSKLDEIANTRILSTPKPVDEIPNELDIWEENNTWNE